MTTSSYDFNAAGNSSFFGNYSDMSDFKFDTSFALESDDDWLTSIWGYTKDFAKSEVGSGLIVGAAGAALSSYQQQQKQDALDKQFAMTREDGNAWREQQLALQHQQLALQQAVFDDKVNTRKAHNASINRKPNNAKSIKFG